MYVRFWRWAPSASVNLPSLAVDSPLQRGVHELGPFRALPFWPVISAGSARSGRNLGTTLFVGRCRCCPAGRHPRVRALLLPGRRVPTPRAGVLRAARNDFPARLQRLDPNPLPKGVASGWGPQIVYPADGALIEWRGEELPLEAPSAAKQPLRWLVDGTPLPSTSPRRPINWQPEGVGFARLTVIDGEGRSAHSTVRLSPD
jgi:hypothetical protein